MKGKLMFNEHYNWEQLEYNETILKSQDFNFLT